MQFSPERRRVLALGAATGAMMAMHSLLPATAQAKAKAKQLTLDECLALSPDEMAARSAHVTQCWAYLGKTVGTIADPELRAAVRSVLENPAPTLLARMDAKTRADVFAELSAKGYLKDATVQDFLPPANSASVQPQSFRCTAGSGYQSHHCYPGGLVTHTAGNLKISLAIHQAYKDAYGLTMDRDVVLASQALHDLHKPWVFQWQADGASRTEAKLSGQGQHHVLGVAESIVRGFPAEVVVAQACAHNHPGTAADEADVVGWLNAACILAGADPVALGLLDKGGKSLPLPRRMEGFITHLGDHDYVLTVPAAQWTIAAMGELARSRYGMSEADLKGARFNALRNYAFSQATVEELYAVYSTKGQDGLATAVTALVKPV